VQDFARLSTTCSRRSRLTLIYWRTRAGDVRGGRLLPVGGPGAFGAVLPRCLELVLESRSPFASVFRVGGGTLRVTEVDALACRLSGTQTPPAHVGVRPRRATSCRRTSSALALRESRPTLVLGALDSPRPDTRSGGPTPDARGRRTTRPTRRPGGDFLSPSGRRLPDVVGRSGPRDPTPPTSRRSRPGGRAEREGPLPLVPPDGRLGRGYGVVKAFMGILCPCRSSAGFRTSAVSRCSRVSG